MCDPVSLLGFGLSAASTVTGFMAQSSQASAQTKMYDQNKLNAERAFADTNRALSVQEEQQQAADSQKRQENDLATRSAQATALAAGAAGGVQGISLEEVLGDFGARDARANSAINEQDAWDVAQAQAEKTGAGDQEVSRINSVNPGIKPSFLDAGLRIGVAGIQSVTQSQRNQLYGVGGFGMPGFGMPGSINGNGG